MTSVLLLSALLSTEPSAQRTVPVRFAEQPQSPAEIVTVPCSDGGTASVASRPRGLQVIPEGVFSVGLATADGRRLRSYRIGRVILYDRGSSRTKWRLEPVANRDRCGTVVAQAVAHGESDLGLKAIWLYVAELQFEDGTSWKVADEARLQAQLASAPLR